jgi:hypothetical protein
VQPAGIIERADHQTISVAYERDRARGRALDHDSSRVSVERGPRAHRAEPIQARDGEL